MDVEGATLLGMCAEEAADQLQGILNGINAELPTYPYALSRQEHLATLGWFLYRKTRPGLWVNAATALPEAETILAELREQATVNCPLNPAQADETDAPTP